MSVYLMASVPFPNLELLLTDPQGIWNLVVEEDGTSPQGWTVHKVRDCQAPNRDAFIGRWLCRDKSGVWIPVAPGDESNNGIWFLMNGTLAAYNPEPGGVTEFRRIAVTNA